MSTSNQKIIGRIEQVNLPEWEFYNLEAKIDTGAFTSSLHCHHLEPYTKDGESWIRFYMLDPDHDAYNNQLIEMPLHDKREVKSSNGETELRYFIKTSINFFNTEYTIEFSLTDRSAMKYPLLLGRKFLRKGPYIVDVTRKNLTQNSKTRES
ncbi:MAG: RimK/LysX family protein [Balneolaceae bacterium]